MSPHKPTKKKPRSSRSTHIKSPQGWRQRQVKPAIKKQSAKRKAQSLTYKTARQASSRPSKKPLLKRLLVWGISFGLVVVAIFFIAVAWMSRDLPTTTSLENRQAAQSTRIYDRTGETLLWEVFDTQQRTPIKLDNLPNYIKWASITAEDRGFYSHRGFDIKGFARAVAFNILGRGRPGGSTISQQLIKNVFLTSEKTYTRKIKELILAWQLEKRFSKDEILELYLNEIPYGSTAYGIEAAANRFFSKKAHQLNLNEAALLAALPQAPTYYSPYGPNKDGLLARKNFILTAMAKEGYVTKAEAEAAKSQELEFNKFGNSIRAPHFVFYVREQLAERYGEEALERDGLKVITTLDLFKQNIAEAIIEERGEFNTENYNANNAALLALNPKTGEILTMVGSRDFFNEEIDGEVNVTLRPRQPGSSFKPVVYATAFAEGLTPDTMLFDLETTFDVEPEAYAPKNYNDKTHGPVNIRQALGSSLNIPAVKTTYLVGIEKVLDLTNKLHYSTFEDSSRFGLSIVLGGGEVIMLEHLAAYATFAREGVYHPPVSILKVEDREGNILEEFDPAESGGEEIIAPQTARLITSSLTDNKARLLTFQPNNYLFLGERPVAAKTGTTNDFRDAWTFGYTPSLAVGVWVGNNDNSPMGKGAAGGAVASPIWNAFMKQILGDTPIETFNTPDGYATSTKPMINGSLGFERVVDIDTSTGLLATKFTPSTTRETKTFSEIHNILHYVRRGNILGPIPTKPWADPNYTNWELPVEEWLKEQGITQGKPPTEFESLHLEKDQPSLVINQAPAATGNTSIQVVVSGKARRGLRRIDYFIDIQKIHTEYFSGDKSITNHLVDLSLTNTPNGQHQLRVAVYDDLENEAIATKPLLIDIIGNPITAPAPSDNTDKSLFSN